VPQLKPLSAGAALAAAFGTTVLTGGALALAFSPAQARTPRILIILGATYGLLAAATAAWLRRRGVLRQRLAPAYGDVTKGFLTALGLYVAAYLLHQLCTGRGSSGEPWILRAYLHVGDPFATGAWAVAVAVFLIASCEELVWRGGVMALLVDTVGGRRAWLGTTMLYGLSYAPTVVLLADPVAGPNPLLLIGALVGGAVWGGLVLLFRRLMPIVFGHGLLAWALMAFPLWRP
jgi:hypothetical protein